MFFTAETLVGSASALGSSTMCWLNPEEGIINSSSTALMTIIAILITNEYIPKLKVRYTKLRHWINVITLLYEKTSKTYLVHKKIDQKEAEELKKKTIIILIKENKS